ncbi:MAG: response regulator [Nanobdellota archaeon]
MKKILVVDDNPDIRFSITAGLEGPYEFQEATDGKKALELAKKEEPDGIILDILMPKMDGWEFIQEFRKENTKTPIIILTASTDSKTRKKSNVTGELSLEKPFEMENLKKLVDENF